MFDKIKDTAWNLKYCGVKYTVKEAAKDKINDIKEHPVKNAANVILDVATIATGAGAAAKTAKTASKLAKCGKGTKMVATFTANAQKKNVAKATKKIVSYQAGKVVNKMTTKKKND